MDYSEIYSDKNYGAGQPDCPICGGTGYVYRNVPDDHPQFGKLFDCACRTGEVEAKRQEYLRKLGGLHHLAEKTFDSFNLEIAGLPEHHAISLRRAHETAARFAEVPDGWLVLMGGYGCGKTHLAAAIANYQIETGNRVLFVTAPDLLDHIRSAFSYDVDESSDTRFNQIRTVPVLILDDLGIESPTPWAVEKLYQLLNYRYNAQLPTVITTNHDLQDIEARIRSRLSHQGFSQIVLVNAPDYRLSGMGDNELGGLSIYRHMTFQSFVQRKDISDKQRNNLGNAYHFALGFAENPSGWLVFMGGYGSGKTHLAAAIANAVADKGAAVMFVTIPDLLDHLRATYAPNSSTSYDKRFNEVKSANILILDDLGTESATPWAREKLYQLFNYRYNAQLPTVITTPHQLENLDERLVIRLRDKRITRLVAILAPAFTG